MGQALLVSQFLGLVAVAMLVGLHPHLIDWEVLGVA